MKRPVAFQNNETGRVRPKSPAPTRDALRIGRGPWYIPLVAFLLLLSSPLNAERTAPGEELLLSGTIAIDGAAGARDEDHAFEDLTLRLDYSLRPKDSSDSGGREGNSSLSGQDDTRGLLHTTEWYLWEMEASWTKGFLLYFPWFINLEELTGSLSAKGKCPQSGLAHGGPVMESLHLEFPFMTISAKDLTFAGSCTAPSLNHERLFERPDAQISAKGELAPLFRIGVKEPFSLDQPLLDRLDVEGTFEAIVQEDEISVDIHADVHLDSAPLVSGLVARLPYPLDLATGVGEPRCKKGSISWQGLDLSVLTGTSANAAPLVRLETKSLPVTICDNRAMLGPATLLFPHGRLSIGRLSIALPSDTGQDILADGAETENPSPSIALEDVDLKDIDLRDFLSALPFPVLAEARGLSARLLGDRLIFDGKITMKVAGGTISIDKIWIEPFAPVVRYGADMTFDRIDLAMLTEGTEFGLMTGWIEGELHDLVMSGGQPESFELVLRSDPDYRGSRKISIKAIENLAILGGSGGGIPVLGMFFKKFSYSRIGLSCTLANDVFELHGLMRKGDVEYLVERGLLGGVDVVNMNPDGKISFADMVERLERITTTDFDEMEVE